MQESGAASRLTGGVRSLSRREPKDAYRMQSQIHAVQNETEEEQGIGAALQADIDRQQGPCFGLARLRRVLRHPSLAWHLLNAQLRLRRHARVPLSVRLEGKARAGGGGSIAFGDFVHIVGNSVPAEFVAHPKGRIEVGEGTFINYGTSISAHEQVSIGRRCQIGQYCIINDNDYHEIGDKRRLPPSQPVILEDRVWLGARVIVLKGVRIGHDAVIGAGSVVTRDIPRRSVAVGMPARVVRRF
jgi:acetyltransferase-like isoleucine patch superfamily enzyme